MPDLYLMRHGQTHWNAAGRLQGALDSPLTELGVAQARLQAQLVRDIDAMRFSSPQGRAMQTAAIVFGDQYWQCDPRLAEIGIGSLAGCDVAELRARHPAIFRHGDLAWYDHCPGGEGLTALRTRCRDFLDHLTEPAMVITHGVTLAMLVSIRTERDFADLDSRCMRQGGVLHLSGRAIRSLS